MKNISIILFTILLYSCGDISRNIDFSRYKGPPSKYMLEQFESEGIIGEWVRYSVKMVYYNSQFTGSVTSYQDTTFQILKLINDGSYIYFSDILISDSSVGFFNIYVNKIYMTDAFDLTAEYSFLKKDDLIIMDSFRREFTDNISETNSPYFGGHWYKIK